MKQLDNIAQHLWRKIVLQLILYSNALWKQDVERGEGGGANIKCCDVSLLTLSLSEHNMRFIEINTKIKDVGYEDRKRTI